MRIKVRDFWVFIGLFISSFPLLLPLLVGENINWGCVAISLVVGIPMLVYGLHLQRKYYGDNRMVKWILIAWLIGLLLTFIVIRCSVK